MQSPKGDCEVLLGAVMPFAEQMLKSYGEFLPFGAAMQSDGKVTQVGASDGNEHPQPADLIALLKEGFAAEARNGKYKATALVYDARYKSADGSVSDAIAVALDHRDNYSVVVFFPYTLRESSLSIGQARAEAGVNEIFGQLSSPN
ncbi:MULTISPECIES: hypothetical protein [Rhizobium]|uniref:hypothetical protein n=1 Tax=Rhizobium TaxID=379 RepID=UPI00195CDB79|nr:MULTISPECIES: hypothetical protein [Rhizobium]MBM7049019.1 hypothetical protein [Rhizobium lusitanum]